VWRAERDERTDPASGAEPATLERLGRGEQSGGHATGRVTDDEDRRAAAARRRLRQLASVQQRPPDPGDDRTKPVGGDEQPVRGPDGGDDDRLSPTRNRAATRR
jgi:ParB-like chromosome segregation protein Spo0J